MTWLKVDQSLPSHRKTLLVADRLGVHPAQVVGHMLALWLWALDNTDASGVMGDVTVTSLARVAQWPGNAEDFARALTEARFLDRAPSGDYVIHDWASYGGRVQIARESEREKQRRYRERQSSHRDVMGDVTVTLPHRVEKTRVEERKENGTSADADRATPAETPDETLTVTDSEEQVTAPPDSAPAPPWLVEARQLPKWPGDAERETALAGWLRERGVSDDCALRAAVALRAKWGTLKRHTYRDTEAALRNWCLTQVQIDAKGNGSVKGENARWLEGMRGVERGASRGRHVETI